MSPTTPFRSHLLQQWTQQGRRPPAATMPWLRPSPGSSDHGEEGRRRLHSRHNRPPAHREAGLHSPRDHQYHSSSPNSNGKSSSTSGGIPLPSLSSIEDTASFQSSFSRMMMTSQSQQFHITATTGNHGNGSIRMERNRREPLFSAAAFSTASVASKPNLEEHIGDSISAQELAADLQSLLLSRQTAAKPLVHATRENDSSRKDEIDQLRAALDKAVEAAMMAPNHKRTEPFSFKRIWANSRAAATLSDICYHVTVRKKKSEPVARKKQEKWSRIPAFLVALVHNNQVGVDVEANDDQGDSFSQLKYSPPTTERQLEDVSEKLAHFCLYSLNCFC